MKEFDLYELSNQITGVSKAVGDFLAEAAQVCLEKNGHHSGVEINVSGIYSDRIKLNWNRNIDETVVSSWKDWKEATEYGATAISLLLVTYLGEYRFAERLPQFSIGDYFLKKSVLENSNTGDESYVEISGILHRSNKNTVNVRITQKKAQLKNKSLTTQNILISIIEFSSPKAKIVRL